MKDNDVISFDLLNGEVSLHVSDEELAARRAHWQPPVIHYQRGYLADFAATVTQASRGCVSRSSLARLGDVASRSSHSQPLPNVANVNYYVHRRATVATQQAKSLANDPLATLDCGPCFFTR